MSDKNEIEKSLKDVPGSIVGTVTFQNGQKEHLNSGTGLSANATTIVGLECSSTLDAQDKRISDAAKGLCSMGNATEVSLDHAIGDGRCHTTYNVNCADLPGKKGSLAK